MQKIIAHRFFTLIVCLLLVFLITLPSLKPVLNVDAYCNIYAGYLGSAKHFMKSGRIFTSVAFLIAKNLNISFFNISTISIILSNIFMSLSIYKIYRHLEVYSKNKSIYSKLLLFIGAFLFVCNPLTMEFLLFQEGFIMWIGFYFVVLAGIKSIKNTKMSYLNILIYLCIATTCYQGIACFFLPISFLFYFVHNKDAINIKDFIKKFFMLTILYGLSLIFTYVIVKIVNSYIFTDGTPRLGELDILYNIKKIFELFFYSLIGLFGMTNRIVFYAVGALLFVITILLCRTNKAEKNNLYFMFIILNILLCCVMPFVPNLALNKDSNYTAARMVGSIGSVHGLMILYGVLLFNNKRRILKTVFVTLSIGYFLYNGCNYFNTMRVNALRYQSDIESIEVIKKHIISYEKESGNTVKNIYYATDSNVDYFYYNYQLTNSYNYRLYAIDWAMTCAVNMDDNNKYNYEIMPEDVKQELFENKEYDMRTDSYKRF